MLDLIQKAKTDAKKRNFTQSLDLTVVLQNVDLKKPENRFTEKLQLPFSPGTAKICVIGDSVADKSKEADLILSSKDLEKYSKDKKEAKILANSYDFFLAEASVMAQIAKSVGGVFGPRGKMPEPLPPGSDPSSRIKNLKRTVVVKLKEQPLIQCKVGDEKMSGDHLKENIDAVVSVIKSKMPKGASNIKKTMIKLTMGPAVKIS